MNPGSAPLRCVCLLTSVRGSRPSVTSRSCSFSAPFARRKTCGVRSMTKRRNTSASPCSGCCEMEARRDVIGAEVAVLEGLLGSTHFSCVFVSSPLFLGFARVGYAAYSTPTNANTGVFCEGDNQYLPGTFIADGKLWFPQPPERLGGISPMHNVVYDGLRCGSAQVTSELR
ncbi:hypothetical protein DFP72DRAFT_901211 [Ephemerocybe angulata]|uniref:Uncharacterized protein n=1 Tax=Ephemerocybe angulata TaxID=980116 RepID=A0A8H6M5E0_9AGAR|nr:hypothetical protein DFP72DRAFT_901211 [Tulosesus angulatus]